MDETNRTWEELSNEVEEIFLATNPKIQDSITREEITKIEELNERSETKRTK